jgi:hypothetical protein
MLTKHDTQKTHKTLYEAVLWGQRCCISIQEHRWYYDIHHGIKCQNLSFPL